MLRTATGIVQLGENGNLQGLLREETEDDRGNDITIVGERSGSEAMLRWCINRYYKQSCNAYSPLET